MLVKPIETRAFGRRFRSRLDARWAVFFSSLGLPWEYEPEGFAVGEGLRYLPDFRVTYPGRGSEEIHDEWFEVKPRLDLVTPLEWQKMLAFDTGYASLIVLDGEPATRMYLRASEIFAEGRLSPSALKQERSGWALWSGKGRLWWDEQANFFSPTTYFGDSTEIEDAVSAALSARFEHGESPL